MPLWTYTCAQCGASREELFASVRHRDCTVVVCRACCTPMARTASTTNFVVTGFNADNGYAAKGHE